MSTAADIKNIENDLFTLYSLKCLLIPEFLPSEIEKLERLAKYRREMTFDELVQQADFVTTETIKLMKERNMPPLIVEISDLDKINCSCDLCNMAAHISMCEDEEKKKQLIEALTKIQKKL